jgi:hypothetical protein
MTGILLLLVTGTWLLVVAWVSKVATRKLPIATWRIPIAGLIFVGLLPLPLTGEIVGGRQFARLCEANVVRVNKEAALGGTVYVDVGPNQIQLSDSWVRVWKLPFRYRDPATGEVIVSFDQLHAEGGRLFPGFDSGRDPLTFNGECHPAGVFEKNYLASLGLTLVNKPQPK